MMEVGVLQFTVRLPGCRSLKQKRKVIRSIKERLRARYNVSVAEVDHLDLWNSGVLGLTTCGNDSQRIVALLQKILNQLAMHPEAQLVDHQIDLL